MTHILAIDQGTTSTRAILFDANMAVTHSAQQEFTQHYPQSGWVEHEAADLLQTTLDTCRDVLAQAGLAAGDIAGIGITNQRETTVVWEQIDWRGGPQGDRVAGPAHRILVQKIAQK